MEFHMSRPVYLSLYVILAIALIAAFYTG